MSRNAGVISEALDGAPEDRLGGNPVSVRPSLLRRALATHGRVRCMLVGDSMAPTLPAGCQIEVAPLPADVALGRIVVFAEGEALVAHRLVQAAGPAWIARGDNRAWPDRPRGRDQAVGVVVAAFGDGVRVWPGRLSALAAAWWLARHQMWRVRGQIGRAMRRRSLGGPNSGTSHGQDDL